MGKLSGAFILMLSINIIGHILLSNAVVDGLASGNPYIESNTLLVSLYAPTNDGSGDSVYLATSGSTLGGSVPADPPDEFSTGSASFIDRILVVFSFIGALLTALAFPVALISFMGLPWELSLLLFAPLGTIYIMGFIDLFSGGNS